MTWSPSAPRSSVAARRPGRGRSRQTVPSATSVPRLAALLVLAGTLAVGGCKRATPSTTSASAEAVSAATSSAAVAPESVTPDRVVVYYFHKNRRCRTCVGIQQAIKATIDERFGEETASGLLTFREVNIDEPANAQFVQKYDLSFSSMVVVAQGGETAVKWQNCDQVWPLARDEEALKKYAEAQIRAHLDLVPRS